MSPQRFRQIDDVFQKASAVTGAARRAVLDECCANDPELRAEVESLLDAEPAAPAMLACAIDEAAAALPTENNQDSDVGRRVGPYLLVRQIGRGGMGVVYQAIRSDGEFLHTVAVKLVRRGMDSDGIVRRFRAERQILAALSHPNIAALLDGGTSEDGRPYLVMEYIEGEGLMEYVQRLQLDARSRVQLFTPLCRAVESAHNAGILHRDLKPGNVMVTQDGVPKLLDFGIAKLLETDLVAGDMPATETQARLMTPDYASPEQIRGERLTPATDVYSLGVLLYQLLTGKRPYSITGRSMTEIERAITEQTVPRPSEVAESPRLRSALAGDLDNIVAMAMRREPERRYSSAAELGADLGRFLEGMPVRARRDSAFYRASKWTRRHAMAVTSGASLAAASGLGGAWWWSRRRQVSPDVLDLCSRAETLMRSDIRSAHPGEGLPAPLRESIALWTEATKRASWYVPAWTGLASTAEFAIDYDASRRGELRALAELAASRALELDPKSAAAYAVRGSLRFRDWRFAAAAREFARSVELDSAQPYIVADWADCLSLTGRQNEAIDVVERWLAKNTPPGASVGPNVRVPVVLLSNLAGLYRVAGNYEKARDAARRSIRLQGNYAPARLQLGMVEQQSRNLAAAEREYRAAYDMRPGDQRNAAALGNLYALEGRRAEADAMVQQLNRLHEEGVLVSGSMALIAAGFGDTARAVEALEAAETAREAGLPYRLTDWRLKQVLGHERVRAIAQRVGLGSASGQ